MTQDLKSGMPAIGNAKDVDCPVCFARHGEHCQDQGGRYRPPHVERGRTARWVSMFNL